MAGGPLSPQQEAELKELGKVIEDREAKIYSWMRYLVGLASGALTIFASLQTHREHGAAGIAQGITWISLGCGILLGSLRLYGEVAIVRGRARDWGEQLKRRWRGADDTTLPIVSNVPAFVIWSEWGCYASLVVAVISIVIFGIIRTG